MYYDSFPLCTVWKPHFIYQQTLHIFHFSFSFSVATCFTVPVKINNHFVPWIDLYGLLNKKKSKHMFSIWGSSLYFNSKPYCLEELYLLGYNAFSSTENQPMYRKNTSPPSSVLKNKSNKKPTQKQVESIRGATCSSEKLADFQRTT